MPLLKLSLGIVVCLCFVLLIMMALGVAVEPAILFLAGLMGYTCYLIRIAIGDME